MKYILKKAGLDKTSSTRMIRMVQAGKLSAESAGRASKKLNLKPRYIKFLGKGGEGISDLVTYPGAPTGLAAKKTYNIGGGLYSDALFKYKDKQWSALGSNKNFANYYGKDKNKKPIAYHEYIKGDQRAEHLLAVNPVGEAIDALLATGVGNKIKKSIAFLKNYKKYPNVQIANAAGKAAKEVKIPIGDVLLNPGNIINNKVIDFYPKNQKILSTTPVNRYIAMSRKIIMGKPWQYLTRKGRESKDVIYRNHVERQSKVWGDTTPNLIRRNAANYIVG